MAVRTTDVVPSLDVIVRLDRTIHYAVQLRDRSDACVDWMPAFAGMTASFERSAS